MKTSWIALALVVAALQGCERQPVVTVVHPPADAASAAMPAEAASSSAVAVVPAAAEPPVTSMQIPAASAAQAAASAPPTSAMGSAPAASAAAGPGATITNLPMLESAPSPKAAASSSAAARPEDAAALLLARQPLVPVQGVSRAALVDTYDQKRGAGRHEAIDIMAPRGTPVVAVDDGTVAKLFNSKRGGLTVYQFDEAGQLAYYYAHLDRYAEGLREGMTLRRGERLGYVGFTGDAVASAPHLHFAVFRLGPQKQWWKGDPVNPYAALRGEAAALASR